MAQEDSEPTDLGDSGDEPPLEAIPLHSTNLLTVLDADGVVRYESPSIERIFGFDQTDLVGSSVAEFLHPDDRDRVIDAFRAVVAAEEHAVEAVEYRHERADGTYVWVESAASSNPTPEGHYVVNTRDVSDRKERERELERTNERLDEFASVVSHDLRNPLTVASLRLDMAMEDSDDPNLEYVARAHDRMDTLIEDLLSLARSGEAVQSMESLDLAVQARTCWRTIATADATLDVRTDQSVKADRSRLQQLLENLMRNAIGHAGDEVTVTVGALDSRRGFYVEDDGPGLPADERDAVFESGYSTQEDGTGLGLTIVREIADAHGWTVDLSESSAGGARFEFAGVDLA